MLLLKYASMGGQVYTGRTGMARQVHALRVKNAFQYTWDAIAKYQSCILKLADPAYITWIMFYHIPKNQRLNEAYVIGFPLCKYKVEEQSTFICKMIITNALHLKSGYNITQYAWKRCHTSNYLLKVVPISQNMNQTVCDYHFCHKPLKSSDKLQDSQLFFSQKLHLWGWHKPPWNASLVQQYSSVS